MKNILKRTVVRITVVEARNHVVVKLNQVIEEVCTDFDLKSFDNVYSLGPLNIYNKMFEDPDINLSKMNLDLRYDKNMRRFFFQSKW